MSNYQNGQIYSIRSHIRPDLVYVGATCRRLSERFGKHKVSSNRTTSKQIIDLDDAYIELIENHACDSKEKLNKREGEFIRSMDCVNKVVAGRTVKEYRESEHGKHIQAVCQKKYKQSEHGKLLQALCMKKYRQSKQGKQIQAVCEKNMQRNRKNANAGLLLHRKTT